MPSLYGNQVARHVVNGIAKVGPGGWARLVATGTTPLEGRQWVKVYAKGRMALAIQYTMRNADGTYTEPAGSAHPALMYPANTMIEEPIADNVMLWGRAVNKAGSSDGGLRVIVNEYK